MQSDELPQGGKKPLKDDAASQKKKRLAEALRQNLAKRRGAQAGKNQVDKAR